MINLTEANVQTAIELAALPLSIRGFGHVKQANAKIAADRKRALLERFNGAPRQVVNIVDPAAHSA